ncbi:CenpB-DNA-bind-domain-containing protein [Aaosphaeria arxii CBS 175.79]|uniref:CenpB-DNA-bind-domain-containing protein n=1 Tax=Aaosphaeria arxii CBS 175.79 TaxID=1450172 RepID=A0A6A5X8E6_9PLEO|nr:CenpB-DNA-bind-domain-containing protein [Aaosphaeria arxii CBS 175.79]KAF2009186.1 CenpB-DNA-bind-domain-containing protein [Aaosphaeria arxii CBS 175.79]
MSQLQMDHDPHNHHHHSEQSYDDHNAGWHDTSVYGHSQHQSSVQDFNALPYNNTSYTPLPMEPIYTTGMHPPRTTHPQLQPLIMPQWPSMLTSQSTYVPPIFPSAAPVPITPASATPVSATSTRSHSSTPRKTLTDADRRRMCLYHEEHPTVKQTEIGAMFGVERSTVSKVLRQKEKYLYQDDGSRSPIRKSKGKFPDIERALANWARNHQKQGLPLNDSIIREKARFFATTVGNSESHLKANSTSWLEKFKQKNNLMGAKSRKGSIAEESEGASNPPSNAQTPVGVSPTSPNGISPSPLTVSAKKSEENLKTESPDSYDFSNHRRPFHSQSNTSLSSVFTDTAPSSFSAGPTSPTSLSSPFFTPDSACGPNPFMGNQQARGQPGSSNFQRPRSQTFPMLVGVEQYMSPPASSEALTPKYINSTALDSPMTEIRSSIGGADESMQASPTQATSTMQPPPVPSVPPVSIPMQQPSVTQAPSMSLEDSSPVTPSQEEAARALELVMSFFQTQPSGFVEPQEYVMIGKLMEKLKIKRHADNLSSEIRRIPEPDFSAASKLESIDGLH